MNIFLLTLPDGTFGSAGQSWKRIDLVRMVSKLNFDVVISSIDNIESLKINDDDIVIYTSSENESIRSYLKNSFYFLKSKVTLVPNYKILMAHEDKSFQEVWKKEDNFGNLIGRSIFDINNHKIDFPKVFKSAQGAGSSSVFLVKNKLEIIEVRRKVSKTNLKKLVIKLQRKLKLNKNEYSIYKYRRKDFSLLVEQEFIPDLKHDFKVLVFGDRYFVLRRGVRKNDFRASGSGNFEFVDPPCEVLNYAKYITKFLDCPYLSLDIAQSDSGCHLIEFQGTNFGPYTLLNAPYFYTFDNEIWCKVESFGDLEENYAHALNKYISKKI